MDSIFLQYFTEEDPKVSASLFNNIKNHCRENLSCFDPVREYLNTKKFDDKKSLTYIQFCNVMSIYNMKEAIHYAKKGVNELEKNNLENMNLFNLLNRLALGYAAVSKVDSTLFFAEKSEKLLRKLGSENNYWRPDYARSNAYEALNKKELAFNYLEKSYEYLRNSKNRMDKGYLLFTLLDRSNAQHNSKAFDKYLKEYIQFGKEGNKKLDEIHSNLSTFFKNDSSMIKILEDKIKKLESDTIKYTPRGEKLDLIKLYTIHGKNEKAIINAREMLSDSLNLDDYTLHNTYLRLIENYEALKKWDSAFYYSKQFNHFINKRYDKNLSQNIADYEVKYNTQIKENEVQKQKAINAENKLNLQTLYGLLGGLGVLSLLTIFFFSNRIKQQKIMNIKEQEIQDQKIRRLEQENKVLALNSMIEGQEAERMRIAQDLHDGLGGLLTTVKAHFSAIEREIDAVKKFNVFDKTNTLIDQACVEVRRIAHDMVPYSVQISGLKGALDELEQSIRTRGIECELDLHNLENLSIDSQKTSMIYRILQELTNNAVKHSGAEKILVQLLFHENMLHIMVEDNGNGFDVNQVVQKNGMGLKSIDSRVKYLNGKINYDSTPQHGTTVNIDIPVY
jgi:two-component system NarL family sensor kinase